MFRILIRQLHIKIPDNQLFFPVSRVSMEKEELWDHEVLKKKEKYQIIDLAHSKASTPELNQT